MKPHRLLLLLLILAGGLLPLPLFWSAPAAAATPAAVVDPALQAALAAAEPDAPLRILLHLHGRADLTAATLPAGRVARRTAVVRRLQTTAVSAQAALLQQLDALADAGAVTAVRPFWIVNAVAATATPAAVARLAAHPDVARITLDTAFPFPDAPASAPRPSAAPATTNPAWNISRVNAPHAWHALGVDGAGVTVAIVDTGVDFLHPDLLPNYRGNLGGGHFDHAGSWYHAAVPSITVPADPIGHGTHVAGSAVGQNGIGVAPGARWIAVALSDASGLIYDSAIHAAFQWLLAPNGDPALAPDVVNNSWSNPYGTVTTFLDDVRALQAAGITPLFAAGNRGPTAGTVGAPASYTDTLAIGASDDADGVAWFSSRGPSPLTPQVKPHLAAPGTRIRSTFPGAQYAVASGTSMATPHVAGAVALLLSADPGLTAGAIFDHLATTAVSIAPPHPNDDVGWGRLDAYAATAAADAGSGRLTGILRLDGAPLPNVVVTVTTPAGVPLPFLTNANGRFHAPLQPGSYDLFTAPFGAQPQQIDSLQVRAGHTTSRNLFLSSLPAGAVTGQVRAGGAPVAGATVRAAGTPATVQTGAYGRYTLPLPAGAYDLVVSRNGYRRLTLPVQVAAGQTGVHDVGLSAAPSILLIDAGPWLFSSEISYLEAALAHDRRSYDRWTIRDPFNDAPTLPDVSGYDVLIWSDPFGSPGRITANDVITDYLGGGGRLIISGQDVGRYDGVGFGNQYWWRSQLQARFVGELRDAPQPVVGGAPGTPFAGLTVTLNGPDGAANQLTPDVVAPAPWSLTTPILTSTDGAVVGLQAGACTPYRLLYFGFGLEGVGGTADRAALLARSFDALAAPPVAAGVRWLSPPVDDLALPGSTLTYTLTLHNLSETVTDTFDLQLTGTVWPTALLTPTLTLPPCASAQTVVTVTLPAGLPRDAVQAAGITAVSRQQPAVTTSLQLRHKTPGQLLLVDADRFYEHEARYLAPLAALGVPADVWDVGGTATTEGRGSPPPALLHAYDFLIWFTGNDWYEPVSPADRASLLAFLDAGRLFLSSQDFLYDDAPPRLLHDYFGVLSARVDVTPTRATAAALPGTTLTGTLPIDYGTTRNQGDGLLPGTGRPYLWHDQGLAAALLTAGPTWRSSFWSIPFERLPAAAAAAALNDVLGWLGDLGGSAATFDARSGAAGVTRTLTITVENWIGAPVNQVAVTVTLPAGLTPLPDTLDGAQRGPAAGQLLWQGTLAPGARHLIQLQALPDAALPPGTRLDVGVALAYARHALTTRQQASLWIAAPDLRPTTLHADWTGDLPTRTVTMTLRLHNQGLGAAAAVSATVRLPDPFHPLTPTLSAGAGAATVTRHRLNWHGELAPGTAVTVTLRLTAAVNAPEVQVPDGWFLATAHLHDGVTDPLVRSTRLWLPPYHAYFPVAPRPP